MIEQNIMEELRKFNAQSRRQNEGHGEHGHCGGHGEHRHHCHRPEGAPYMNNCPRNGWEAYGPKAPVRGMGYGAPANFGAPAGRPNCGPMGPRPNFGGMNGAPVGMAPMHKMPACPNRMPAKPGCGAPAGFGAPANFGAPAGRPNCGGKPAHRPGFGHGAFRILDKLSETEGISQTALADALEIRPQSVSEAVRALAAKGWVKKELCGEDRRAVRVFLTEEGAIARAEMQEMREHRAQKKFGNLTEDEKAELLRLLKKLNNSDAAADEAKAEDAQRPDADAKA